MDELPFRDLLITNAFYFGLFQKIKDEKIKDKRLKIER